MNEELESGGGHGNLWGMEGPLLEPSEKCSACFFFSCPSLLSSPLYLSPLLLLISSDILPFPAFSPDWDSRMPVVLFSWPLPLAPSQSQLVSLRTKEAAGRHCFHKSSHILGPKSTYVVLIISSSINGEQLYALCVFSRAAQGALVAAHWLGL